MSNIIITLEFVMMQIINPPEVRPTHSLREKPSNQLLRCWLKLKRIPVVEDTGHREFCI